MSSPLVTQTIINPDGTLFSTCTLETQLHMAIAFLDNVWLCKEWEQETECCAGCLTNGAEFCSRGER